MYVIIATAIVAFIYFKPCTDILVVCFGFVLRSYCW